MSKSYGMRIAGVAAYAPPKVITNDDIAQRLRDQREKLERHRQVAGALPLTADQTEMFNTNDR